MKKICILLCLLLSMTVLAGCSEIAAQVETIASQVDVEALITGAIEKIDWEELTTYAQQGYDTLTEHFPALKAENVKAFLKGKAVNVNAESGENGAVTVYADCDGLIQKFVFTPV